MLEKIMNQKLVVKVKRLKYLFDFMDSSMLNDILGELREIKGLLKVIANNSRQ